MRCDALQCDVAAAFPITRVRIELTWFPRRFLWTDRPSICFLPTEFQIGCFRISIPKEWPFVVEHPVFPTQGKKREGKGKEGEGNVTATLTIMAVLCLLSMNPTDLNVGGEKYVRWIKINSIFCQFESSTDLFCSVEKGRKWTFGKFRLSPNLTYAPILFAIPLHPKYTYDLSFFLSPSAGRSVGPHLAA